MFDGSQEPMTLAPCVVEPLLVDEPLVLVPLVLPLVLPLAPPVLALPLLVPLPLPLGALDPVWLEPLPRVAPLPDARDEEPLFEL